MKKREMMTDADVEREIKRLKESDYVRLAQKEQRLRLRQRKWLYDLRWLEKRGKQLEQNGVTFENIDKLIAEIPNDEE